MSLGAYCGSIRLVAASNVLRCRSSCFRDSSGNTLALYSRQRCHRARWALAMRLRPSIVRPEKCGNHAPNKARVPKLRRFATPRAHARVHVRERLTCGASSSLTRRAPRPRWPGSMVARGAAPGARRRSARAPEDDDVRRRAQARWHDGADVARRADGLAQPSWPMSSRCWPPRCSPATSSSWTTCQRTSRPLSAKPLGGQGPWPARNRVEA